MSTQTAVVPGSLAAISVDKHQTLAESFCNADAVILVDCSGSMAVRDSKGGESRYDVACQELARLQHDIPGKLAVIAFSTDVEFSPAGVPRYMGGSTDLAGALRFAKVADLPGMRFFVISDGYPDNPQKALDIARFYKATISTIYVGPENDPEGLQFLEQLAAAAGGQAVKAERVLELADKMRPLLEA